MENWDATEMMVKGGFFILIAVIIIWIVRVIVLWYLKIDERLESSQRIEMSLNNIIKLLENDKSC